MVRCFDKAEKAEFSQDWAYFVRKDDFKVLNSGKLAPVGFGPGRMESQLFESILREHSANQSRNGSDHHDQGALNYVLGVEVFAENWQEGQDAFPGRSLFIRTKISNCFTYRCVNGMVLESGETLRVLAE